MVLFKCKDYTPVLKYEMDSLSSSTTVLVNTQAEKSTIHIISMGIYAPMSISNVKTRVSHLSRLQLYWSPTGQMDRWAALQACADWSRWAELAQRDAICGMLPVPAPYATGGIGQPCSEACVVGSAWARPRATAQGAGQHSGSRASQDWTPSCLCVRTSVQGLVGCHKQHVPHASPLEP